MGNPLLTIGALLGGIGVAMGAFGAHGLRSILSENMITVFETGVRYHLVHALAMIIAGLSARWFKQPLLIKAGWSFFVGTLVFSGSLYVLALSGIRGIGILTPFGGLAFLIGWGLLAWGYWKLNSASESSPSKS